MNVLSLFSGVGGFDLGLEQAGMTTIYQCEWDKHATNILNRHWPHIPKWGDITTLTAQEILRHGTPPDVVAWGSPCQDLSVAGKRAGLEGERSGLFHEGMRLIRELRKETNNEYPRISIWENVAGALSSNNGADFGVILDEMAEAGAMVIEWSLLDAQHFGIPQRRRRVFVIAIFNPAIAFNCPDPLLPVSESVRRDSPSRKPKGQAASRTLAESIRGDGGIEPYVKSRRAQSSTDYETWVDGGVNPTLNSFDMSDTRATTAIVEPILLDGTRVNDVRVYDPQSKHSKAEWEQAETMFQSSEPYRLTPSLEATPTCSMTNHPPSNQVKGRHPSATQRWLSVASPRSNANG